MESRSGVYGAGPIFFLQRVNYLSPAGVETSERTQQGVLPIYNLI